MVNILSKRKGIGIFVCCVILLGIIIGCILAINRPFTDFNMQELNYRDIFISNIIMAFILIITGMLSFGIISSMILFINGITLGSISLSVIKFLGWGVLLKKLGLHIVPELTAIIIAAIASFQLFYLKTQKIKIRYLPLRFILKDVLILYAYSIGFLLISSVSESISSKL